MAAAKATPLSGFIFTSAALALSACSLTAPATDACSSHHECHAAFGLGTACGSHGFCRTVPSFARCDTSVPADLLATHPAPSDVIVLGSLQDRSLSTQRAREKAMQLAVQQANEQGGIDGVPFAVVFCTVEENPNLDALTRTQAAVADAEHLLEAYAVQAIVGPSASADAVQVFTTVRDRGVLVMSPSASSPVLTSLETETPGLLWRTVPPDTLQAQAISHDMRTPGPGRLGAVSQVHVVHETGAYGEGLAGEFFTHFTQAGGSATLSPFSTTTERTEAISVAATDGAAQEVLFIGQTVHAVAFMNAAASLSGFDGKGLFLTDTAANNDFLQSADPARFPAVRATRPAPLDDTVDFVYAAFVAAYQAAYNEDVRAFSFTAHTYDATWLVMYGAAWAQLQQGAITGAGIAEGLRQLSDASAPAVEVRATSWPTLLERLRTGDTVDLRGASGALDYDSASEELAAPVQVWAIDASREIIAVDTWVPP